MSSGLFLRLCAIRGFKLERAQGEVLQRQEGLARREHALQAACAAHLDESARKRHMAMQWRDARLSLAAFDTQACDGHQAELLRADRRIAQALAAVERCRAERDQAAQALREAQQALTRCRIELNKAERGASHHQALERVRGEALEEDELDELSVLCRPGGAEELRA